MRPPKILKPYVYSFCRQISESRPVTVPLAPTTGDRINQCFNVVKDHISICGGKQQIGWAIWEWPKVLIEAEFHSIWEAPDGSLIDITPKASPTDLILFLPDPEREYRGAQVKNIIRPLTKHRDILRYIELAEARFQELNRGELGHYFGHITPLPGTRIYNIIIEMDGLEQQLTLKFGARP